MSREIPNAALTLRKVPEPDAPWGVIEAFALTYNGYLEAGSDEACAEIANARRNETLGDLRTCLFHEQRGWRHVGRVPDGADLEYIRGLVRQIRERVGREKVVGDNGLPRFWWAALPCIPSARNSPAYRRLRTIWGDQTRFRGADEARYAEFVNPAVETNLMVTLWENFALFPASIWMAALAEVCDLSRAIGTVVECEWSYGWSSERASRIIDIVVQYRTDRNESGVLIVEAKRPGGRMTPKDCAPSTYLDVPELKEISSRRWLLFCVDDAQASKVRNSVDKADDRWRVITWQKLGALQIALAGRLGLPEPVRSFVAGAMQYQYCQHGIRPGTLAAPYLDAEPAMETMDARVGGNGLKDFPPTAALWRLPPS